MSRKMFWLTAYILTGLGMVGQGVINNGASFETGIVLIIGLFYFISLNAHFKELKK